MISTFILYCHLFCNLSQQTIVESCGKFLLEKQNYYIINVDLVALRELHFICMKRRTHIVYEDLNVNIMNLQYWQKTNENGKCITILENTPITYYYFFLMIEKRKPQVKLTNLISYSCVYVKMRVLCAEELSDTKCFIFFLFYKINTSLYFQHKMSINKNKICMINQNPD